MRNQYSTQLTDSTRDEIDTISIQSFFTESESTILYDELEKYLSDALFFLPRYERLIKSTIRLANLSKTWTISSPYQKECFSLHLSAIRSKKNESFKSVPKWQFTFPHVVKAGIAGCCKRTMERGNLFWEQNGCILPAIRKRISPTKTVNFYHKEKMLQEIRIVGDDLFISHAEEDGTKRFLSLNDYIIELVSEIENMVKEAKNSLEKKSQIERGCRPNCKDNMYVNTSLDFQKKRYQISKNNSYIRERLHNGITLPRIGMHISIKPDEIERLLWYTQEQILCAIETLECMSEENLQQIKSPVAYLITCCKNSYNGDFSWKKKKVSTYTQPEEPKIRVAEEKVRYVYTLPD